jgi:multisubunit Na+/H+ antiporter MnhB subunit
VKELAIIVAAIGLLMMVFGHKADHRFFGLVALLDGLVVAIATFGIGL